MPPIPGRAFAVTLGMVAFIGPLAIHLYFPVIPAVKAAFVLSEALAQLTFTIAVFSMGAATLAYGALGYPWISLRSIQATSSSPPARA